MAAGNFPIIRAARPEDLPAIYGLMAAYDMFGEFSKEGCYVAETPDGLAGFARIEIVDGCAYLRPIVIDSAHQGQRIGAALLEHVLRLEPRITVIARGSAVGFYTRSGFERIGWDQILPAFRDECTACPDMNGCMPTPMQRA